MASGRERSDAVILDQEMSQVAELIPGNEMELIATQLLGIKQVRNLLLFFPAIRIYPANPIYH